MRRSLQHVPRILFCAALLGTSSHAAQAQSFTSVSPGSRIQLVLVDSLRQGPVFPARQLIVGEFVRATTDSVWLRPVGAAQFSVATGAIKSARVSRGVSPIRSAFTFGLGLGATLVLAQSLHDIGRSDRGNHVLQIGAIGFGAGFLLGAVSPFESWRRIRW